ncbi:uncharacterized protein LODBEIA_P29520 [Lodderomyces beijingensis]|uniref:Uncharacterized protein n=1 Tax=Lodderomyces beijingensis TaxID=1775926 RepID=A0ABP0ZKQ4_9ASCO
MYDATPSTILSPCDSCLTLNPANLPQQYNPEYLTNYLQSRLGQFITQEQPASKSRSRSNTATSTTSTTTVRDCTNFEITIIHDHHDTNIKLSSIVSLVNTNSNNRIHPNEITVNHLLLYLYYHQFVLFQKTFNIGQLNLIHLGKSYKFSYDIINLKKKQVNDHLIPDLKIGEFPKFLLSIKTLERQQVHEEAKPSKNLRGRGLRDAFDVATFLQRQSGFRDQSSAHVTYADAIRSKLKRNRSSSSTHTTTADPSGARPALLNVSASNNTGGGSAGYKADESRRFKKVFVKLFRRNTV